MRSSTPVFMLGGLEFEPNVLLNIDEGRGVPPLSRQPGSRCQAATAGAVGTALSIDEVIAAVEDGVSEEVLDLHDPDAVVGEDDLVVLREPTAPHPHEDVRADPYLGSEPSGEGFQDLPPPALTEPEPGTSMTVATPELPSGPDSSGNSVTGRMLQSRPHDNVAKGWRSDGTEGAPWGWVRS